MAVHPHFGDVLRTPDERFTALVDWPFTPRYLDDLAGYEGLRAHYVDEGPKDGITFLCLHGEPSWAYLYRHMAKVFLEAGHRVVAPDMFGFGRSDKPVDDAVYTFHFHRNMLKAFIEQLDLKNICLVCQDWGGLLGLTLPQDMTDRFNRLIVMNTTLAIGASAGDGFNAWRDYVANTPDLPVGPLLKRSTPHLTAAEVDAYDAPFPDMRYKAGVRRFPQLVMTDPAMDGVDVSKSALGFWSQTWTGDSFMAIGMADPVLGPPAMTWLRSKIKNCPPPMEIADGGHFVQEWGGPIAKAALEHFGI